MPEARTTLFSTLVALPVRGLLLLVRLYQLVVSPVLPAVFGPACGCRFHPTCSHYAAEALRNHGALRGAWLAVRRLLKCTPLHPGGFDAVPPRRARSARARGPGPHRAPPTCVRLSRPTLSPNG